MYRLYVEDEATSRSPAFGAMLTRSAAVVRRLLTTWLLTPSIVTPLVGALIASMQASSLHAGSRSPVQLAASSQNAVPAPPSHEMVHSPFGSACATGAVDAKVPAMIANKVTMAAHRVRRRGPALPVPVSDVMSCDGLL